MKIRSMQTCIMSSLPHCILDVVFLDMSLQLVFFQTLLFNCNSFTLVANKYLFTYLLTRSTTLKQKLRFMYQWDVFCFLLHTVMVDGS